MTDQDVLARVKITIKVLSPLHVGTGESLNSKSFAVVDGRVCVTDERRLLEAVSGSSRALSGFESFCLGNDTLAVFLKSHGMNATDVAHYTLRMSGTKIGRDLLLFIKTPMLPPLPYLPGSSIKGAVRSTLLRGTLLKHPKARAAAERHVREKFADGKAKRADDAMDQRFFGTSSGNDWQHHDWMRLVQVTDADPVPIDSLEAAEVRTFSLTTDSKLKSKTYVLSPEVIKADTVMNAALVFNMYLASEVADNNLAFRRHLPTALGFVGTCNLVAQEQIAQEIDFYQRCACSELVTWYENLQKRLGRLGEDQCLLRVGWGTGYDAKTISDVFEPTTFDDIRRAYDLPVGRPGRKGPLLPKHLSPKSRKLAICRDPAGHVTIMPLGWVLLTAH